MSSHALPTHQLRFGVEIELRMGYHDQNRENKNWSSFAHTVSNYLTKEGIFNYLDEDGGNPDYTKWTITGDGSIGRGGNLSNRTWGIELISPVGDFNSGWRKHLEIFWKVLDQFRIEESETCGTHIHISIKDQKWTPNQACSLAQAVCYFEGFIDILVPRSRNHTPHCKSNRYNPRLEKLTLVEVFDEIEKFSKASSQEHEVSGAAVASDHAHFEALSKLICYDGNTECGEIHTPKSFRWNFTPLAKKDGKGPRGTVEFRQPPGSTSEAQVLAWVEFTACFVQAAIEGSPKLDPKEPSSLQRLVDFIRAGAKSAGVHDMQYIDSIFDYKANFELHSIQLTTLKFNYDLESVGGVPVLRRGQEKPGIHKRSRSAIVTALGAIVNLNHAKKIRKCRSNLGRSDLS